MTTIGAVNGQGRATGQRYTPELLRVAAESIISSRAELAARAGITFGGKRDLNKALGYADKITPEMCRLRFERGGVAARLVTAYPKATWASGGEIFDDEDPEVDTPFEKGVRLEFTRLKLWQMLLRLDILTGLGRYGVLLIGQDTDFSLPAPKKMGRIITLQPLGEEQASLATLVTDVHDERFGLPLTYNVTLNARSGAKALGVHYTHCIHFVENPLADEIFGEPRLRACWNDLDDLDKLKGGGAEAAWKRAHMGMHANVDPEVTAGFTDPELKEQMEAVSDQLDEYDHNLRRFIKTTGIDIKTLDGAPFNFDANVRSVISLIAATKDIPQRKLMGSGIGEMTGKMEDDSFNDAVQERRDSLAEPLLRRIVDMLIESGAVPKPKGGEYQIGWPEENELDEGAKASVAVQITEANAKQEMAGGDPVMLSSEIRDRYFGMEPIDPKDLPQPEPPPAAPAAPGSGVVPPGDTTPGAVPAAPGAPTPALVTASAPQSQAALHRVADSYLPRLESALLETFAKVRASVDMAALEKAAAEGNRVEAERIIVAAVTGFAEILDEELPRVAVAALADPS